MTYTQMKMSGEQFTEIINNLSSVLKDTRLKASKDGLKILNVNIENVAMIEMVLSKSYFEDYRYAYEEAETEFAIEILKMKKSVFPVKKTDRIRIFMKIEEDITITEILINESRSFIFKSDDIYSYIKPPQQPTIELKNHVEIEAKDLYSAVLTSSKLSERVIITVDEDNDLCFGSEGSKVEYQDHIDYNSSEDLIESRSVYSCDYLLNIAKALRSYRKIDLRFSNDHPISITRSNLGTDTGSYVSYLLAPRIEAD